jgi:hypothetical protein
MKTLKDMIFRISELSWYKKDKDKVIKEEDVKKYLDKFYNDYWKESYTGDKFKKHITCDKLDYLMDKHFGSLVKIETLQDLENQK